jgi:hypothetical protein
VEAVMLRPLPVMIGASVASWAAVTAAGGSRWNPELALGMAGPLLSAVVTWVLVERTHAAAPERVTTVLMGGFAAKLLFFGIYVGLLAALELRLRVFVVSFAVYFIALHAIEAEYLRRLLAGAGSRDFSGNLSESR